MKCTLSVECQEPIPQEIDHFTRKVYLRDDLLYWISSDNELHLQSLIIWPTDHFLTPYRFFTLAPSIYWLCRLAITSNNYCTRQVWKQIRLATDKAERTLTFTRTNSKKGKQKEMHSNFFKRKRLFLSQIKSLYGFPYGCIYLSMEIFIKICRVCQKTKCVQSPVKIELTTLAVICAISFLKIVVDI